MKYPSVPNFDRFIDTPGQDVMGRCSPVVSRAAEQASNLDLTQEECKPYFATLQEEFARDLPSLVLYAEPIETGFGFEHIDCYQVYLPDNLFLPLIRR